MYLKITDRYDMTSSVYDAHTAIMEQTEESMKTDIVFGLFEALRPGKQFFSHVGTEPPLPGYYQYFWWVNISCSRTQHGDPSGARTPRPLDPESEVLTTRPPRPKQILWNRRSYFIGSMIIICLLL